MKSLDIKKYHPANLLEHVGNPDQIAGIKLLEAQDGLARNSRIFQVWTGSGLIYSVLADRALDISACTYKGASLTWLSSIGESHPAYFEAEESEWLRNYGGGLFVTCGLDQFGYPNTDGEEKLGLHGRISNLPARYVNYQVGWKGAEYKLEIFGQVRQSRVFGENILLKRRIESVMGSSIIRIEDEVINEGYEPQAHMILYHFNLGFPLLSEHSVLDVNIRNSIARDAEAESGIQHWMRFQTPKSSYQEQVFEHEVIADSDGKVRVELKNEEMGFGLRWILKKEQLPYLYEWKMLGKGTYVLGVEPANCRGMFGRAHARTHNQLPFLEPGQSCRYDLELEVLDF